MEEVKGKMEDCHTDSELLTQFHKNKPQLRFSGFDDDWEEKKLGEVSDRVTRKNENLESTLPLTISAQYGLVDQITFFNNQIASTTNLRNYFLVKNGEFAYNKSYSAGYPWGAIKRLDRYEKGVLSTLYIVFKPKNINSDYLLSYYDTDKWYKQVSEIAAEGARNHGLLNIAPNDFFQTTFYAPKSENEQQKIGTILSKIDSLIQAKTKKLENLKSVKKSLLQKCFPKTDEKVPEMRFAGFSGDWEEKKLGEIANIYDGTHQTPKYQSTGVKFLSVENIKNLETDKYISTADFVKDFKIYPQKGDILMTRIGDIGTTNIYLSTEPIAFYVSLALLKPTNIDSLFLNYVIQSPFVQNELSLHTLHTAIPKKINKNEISLVKLLIPSSKSEQQKIGHFFSKYDSLISVQQKEIDKLKTIKKSLLQKMFI